MVDAVSAASSLMSYALQNQKDVMSMSLMKKQAQADQAMAQMLMDSAASTEAATPQGSSIGTIINTYA